MPGQRCKICSDKQRGPAEAAIAGGESVRSVARRLKLSYSSLDRHTRNCVPEALKRAEKKAGSTPPTPAAELTVRVVADQLAEQRDQAFADCLTTEVELLHRTTMDVLRESREGKWLTLPDPKDPNNTIKVYDLPNVKVSIRAIAEARKNLALIARLRGELDPKNEERARTVTFEEFEVLYLKARRTVVEG